MMVDGNGEKKDRGCEIRRYGGEGVQKGVIRFKMNDIQLESKKQTG